MSRQLLDEGSYLMEATGDYGFAESPGKGTPYFWVVAKAVSYQPPGSRSWSPVETDDFSQLEREIKVYMTPNTTNNVKQAFSCLGLTEHKPTNEEVQAVISNLAQGSIDITGTEFIARCKLDVYNGVEIEKWDFYRKPVKSMQASAVVTIAAGMDFGSKE